MITNILIARIIIGALPVIAGGIAAKTIKDGYDRYEQKARQAASNNVMNKCIKYCVLGK